MTEVRNHALDFIRGPRTYLPAPDHLIVEVPDVETTRGGIFLPHGGMVADERGGGKLPAIGKVVAMGDAIGEKWVDMADEGRLPWMVGDWVLFHPNVMPIMALEGRMYVVPWDMVWLVVREGEHVQDECGHWRGVYSEGPEEPQVIAGPGSHE